MAQDRQESGVSISGGQVVAGNIGGSGNSGVINGPVTVSGTSDQAADTMRQLLDALAAVRARLDATAGADAEPGDVDDVVEALGKPDIELAGSRWSRLLRRIPESLRGMDGLAKITHLITELHALMS